MSDTELNANSDNDNSDDSAKSVVNVKLDKTTWIYKLNKIQLQEHLAKLSIPYEDKQTVDELRKLLVRYCNEKCKQVNENKSKMANINLNVQAFDGSKWECF
jgi:hypothetical protein